MSGCNFLWVIEMQVEGNYYPMQLSYRSRKEAREALGSLKAIFAAENYKLRIRKYVREDSSSSKAAFWF